MNNRKYLLLGSCDESSSHSQIHPESSWVVVNNDRKHLAEDCSELSIPEMLKKQNLPASGNQIIYAESLPYHAFESPKFHSMISELLDEKGLFLCDNFPPEFMEKFKSELKGCIIPFGKITLMSKTQLSFKEINDILCSITNHDFYPIKFLVQIIASLQELSEDISELNPERQQLLICAYMIVNHLATDTPLSLFDPDLNQLKNSLFQNLSAGTDLRKILTDFFKLTMTRSLLPWLDHTNHLPENLFDQFCENTSIRVFYNLLGVLRATYPWVNEHLQTLAADKTDDLLPPFLFAPMKEFILSLVEANPHLITSHYLYSNLIEFLSAPIERSTPFAASFLDNPTLLNPSCLFQPALGVTTSEPPSPEGHNDLQNRNRKNDPINLGSYHHVLFNCLRRCANTSGFCNHCE